MDEQHSTAPDPHPSTDEHPHGCLNGYVFIGHMVEGDDGDEVEVFETVPYRRCTDSR